MMTTGAEQQAKPKMECNFPEAAPEHQWLQQFAGEWRCDVECSAPDGSIVSAQGSESARMLGGFWLVSDIRNEEMKYSAVQVLGYDREKKIYTGTWFDNMSDYLWQYEGVLDESGKKLTLMTEGPSPMFPGLFSYKEVIEVKGPDHKTFTSAIQAKNGEWKTFLTVNSYRK